VRNSPLGKALLGISRKWKKEIQTAYCSRPHIALGAVEPERGGKPESFCYSSSKAAGEDLEVGLIVCWSKTTACSQRFVVVFWAPGALYSKMPHVRHRT